MRRATPNASLRRGCALPATVLPYNDAGTTMFRVVVGRWASSMRPIGTPTRSWRGLINEARVVQLPKK
jgi:hypothetical protein